MYEVWYILFFFFFFFFSLLCAQSCPTLCDPMDYTVHGILQARVQEWVAVTFFSGSSQPRNETQVFCITDSLPTEPPGKPSIS